MRFPIGLCLVCVACRHDDPDSSGEWLDVDAVVFRSEYGVASGQLQDVIVGEETVTPSFYVHIVNSARWAGRDDEANACVIQYALGSAPSWDGAAAAGLWAGWTIDAAISEGTYGACDQLDPALFGDDVVAWLDADGDWAVGIGPATEALEAEVAELYPEDWDAFLEGRVASELVYRSSAGASPQLMSFATVEAVDGAGVVSAGAYQEVADTWVDGYYTTYPIAGMRVTN